MLNDALFVIAIAILVGVCFYIVEAYAKYMEVMTTKRPFSVTPHAFRSSRGHLVEFWECTECYHPENHPIHRGNCNV